MAECHSKVLIFYSIFGFMIFLVASGEKEVLIRDRLVFLLCDQFDEYMSTGKFPEPVKVMPDKYKSIRPGADGAFEIKPNVSGIKQSPGGNRVKRLSQFEWEEAFVMLDFWDSNYNYSRTNWND